MSFLTEFDWGKHVFVNYDWDLGQKVDLLTNVTLSRSMFWANGLIYSGKCSRLPWSDLSVWPFPFCFTFFPFASLFPTAVRVCTVSNILLYRCILLSYLNFPRNVALALPLFSNFIMIFSLLPNRFVVIHYCHTGLFYTPKVRQAKIKVT